MAAGDVVIHQAPDGMELSNDYQVKANGVPVAVYRANVI